MTDAAVTSTLTVSDALGPGARPELLALRAVEALRGRLLPLPPGATAEPAEPTEPGSLGGEEAAWPAAPASGLPPDHAAATAHRTPQGSALPASTRIAATATTQGQNGTPSAPAKTAEDARPGALALSPTLSVAPGGVPAMFLLRASGGYRVSERLGIEGRLLIPTAAASLSEPEGEIQARLLLMGLGAAVDLLEPSGDWTIAALAGMGAAALVYDAEAGAEAEPAAGSSWAAAPFVGVAAAYRIVPLVALRADAEASLLLPKQIFRVGEREIAAFGQPVVALSLGLEVRP
jgi:hypothetical protein